MQRKTANRGTKNSIRIKIFRSETKVYSELL